MVASTDFTPLGGANPAPAAGPGVRRFGRFQLLGLVGRSDRTMAWRVQEDGSETPLLLVLPRQAVADAEAAQRWAQGVRKGGRLSHPHLAEPLRIGLHDGWPFVLYDPAGCTTLAEHIGQKGLPSHEAVELVLQLLQGLAYAHDAGVAHHDLQPWLALVDGQGRLRLAGLEVAVEPQSGDSEGRGLSGLEQGALAAQRQAAEVDVLAAGLILHLALTGQPPLDERDIGRALRRMPPVGQEVVRLPWSTTHTIPEVLRAIANRAADRQERQRYRNGRTFARALEGWLASDENHGGGPLGPLLERLTTVGLLPAASGSVDRAARLALMDRQRTNELAAVVIDDLALTFEMLRLVNSAQVRGAQVAGTGPVLTVRRAIAMIGLDGVRRAALSLRSWPGPLNEEGAAELSRLIHRVKRAGRVAVALRPAGYDAEVVYVLTVLQNLGRLVVQYHAADEAAQIRRLMQPAPPERPGESPLPGMSEEAAAFSVMGVDIESIGHAVARRWGLDEASVQMTRRLPRQAVLHHPDGDADLLRWTASCANDLVDLDLLSPREQGMALQRLAQRYARGLKLTARDLQEALAASAGTTTADALLADSGNAMFGWTGDPGGEGLAAGLRDARTRDARAGVTP